MRQDGSVWHTWQQPGAGWSGWHPLGNLQGVFGFLALGANADGRLELFAVGQIDGPPQMLHRWQRPTGGGWTDWSPLGSAGGGVWAGELACNRPTFIRGF